MFIKKTTIKLLTLIVSIFHLFCNRILQDLEGYIRGEMSPEQLSVATDILDTMNAEGDSRQ